MVQTVQKTSPSDLLQLTAEEMWELYSDDDSFQRMARGRGFHDAAFLANVLYGKNAKLAKHPPEYNEPKRKNEEKSKVSFQTEVGTFRIDQSLLDAEEDKQLQKENDFEYLWRAKDYSFLPVRRSEDFTHSAGEGVKTDVVIFDRTAASEYDAEREELKDELLAWDERYQARQEERRAREFRDQMLAWNREPNQNLGYH